VLTAGDQGALPIILDAIYSLVIPAIDDVARDEAAVQYVGTFANSPSSTGGAAANATLVLDGQSVKLVGLGRDGQDMIAALSAIWQITAGAFLPPELGAITRGYRLYPSDIQQDTVLEDGRHVIEEDWRFEWGAELTGMETGLPGKGISNGDCRSWAVTDWIYYGQEALDRVVFVRDAETKDVMGLYVPFLRTGLMTRREM
jgi:hypothetical protein